MTRTVLLAGLMAVLSAGYAGAQPAAMVADINLAREDFAEPLFISADFAALGTTVFFVHDDSVHGYELWKTDGTAAGTTLVKDLCPGTCWSRPFSLTPSGGTLLFIADDGVHGHEIWRTDGTAAGTALVTDLKPGLGSGASNLFVLDGAAYFGGDDGVHGRELWKTDGTGAGTVLVADIRPGAEGSSPQPLLDVEGKLLLLADDGVHGLEPWLSNGSAAGTALLKDVRPGPEGSSPGPLTDEASAISLGGGGFLFLANDGVQGLEPWKSDGTETGTSILEDVNPGFSGSSAYGFTPVGGRIVFSAAQDSEGFELWSTDGTEAGTSRLKDIRPGVLSSSPLGFTLFNGQVYFIGFDDDAGRELWRTDGTEAGTVLVKDVYPGPGNAFFPALRFSLNEAGGSLLFFADDSVHGVELWKSDGTEAGTVLLKDIEPGSGIGYASGAGLTVGGTFFFHAATNFHGIEPWKSDGTATGTVEIKNVATLTSSLAWWNGFGPPAFQRVAGRLLLEADDGVSGFEPWVTDGTLAGTQRLGDLEPGPAWSTPVRAWSVGANHLLVTGLGQLWSTDGTPAGTAPLQPPGLLSSADFAPALGALFFQGRDAATGTEIWKTDGTLAGTTRLNDLNSGTSDSWPTDFTEVGSPLVFTAVTNGFRGLWRTAGTSPTTFALTGATVYKVGSLTSLGAAAVFVCGVDGSGEELCRTDGTLPGTLMLKEIRAGADSSSPRWLTRAGSQVFFFAADGAVGVELWKSDGTPAGTVLVEDLRPGAASSQGRVLGVFGTRLVFLADDGVSGAEPWMSDGTAAGTFRLEDLYPGPRSSEIEEIIVAGNRFYFVADDGIHGRELWVSDGTPAGTRLARDIVPGPGSPVIRGLGAMDHLALFSADGGVHGREMWRSNGGPAGTFQVQDIAPGPAPSSPGGFTAFGDSVYFAANDNAAGFELWKAPRAALLTTFQDVPPSHWSWGFVEALAGAGLTGGCAPGQYCPAAQVDRAEMAVFLERGLRGPRFVPPPATGTVFTDVPAGFWAAPWIELLAADGLTAGCADGRYCPGAPVNRAEAAVFLLRAKHGPAYTPPPATGTVFTDVPDGFWAAAWIEQLAAEGLTAGCADGRYCPGDLATRDQMAVFLARTFDLPLP